jgi:hypothetical protein
MMAKRPKATNGKGADKKKVGGPFLAAAFFCDQILQDADLRAVPPDKMGVLSAIRIVDGITLKIPAGLPKGFHGSSKLCGLISFKSGDAKGDHVLRLVMNAPNGKQKVLLEGLSITLNGGRHTYNYLLFLTIESAEGGEGVHWLDVILDGKLYTRMPLLIEHQRVEPDHEEREK